ncbi:xylose isomerase domain-containing protein [Caballeronia humi]|uniref:Xylose isomerase domain-containing protein n=1 Tax=Caballeronia humi TaxID=326474 RepID=A0A158HZC4_9BURK|nr:TIM barrel protein [Caballeronia humi]SAL49319.1 xylose isomerase domain-containing protein [Caballeronia humi]
MNERKPGFKTEVVIVASAFGADAIRRDGHAFWAAAAARAGANGFEVRRELFADDADAAPDALRQLGDAIRALGLWAVFSAPATLFADDGALDLGALDLALDEAAALNARIVKLQLGGTSTGIATDAVTLDHALTAISKSGAQVVVENGQLRAGGTIDAFASLFSALPEAPRALTMTFDTGNWLWAGETPLDAAARLAPYVTYVHCKAVTGEGARRFAVAPAADDAHFAALLSALPADVPRGIEFPFDPAALEADAAAKVAWLSAA